MPEFRFHPELFLIRSRVAAALEAAGYAWFSDYGGIDLVHEEFGLEVRQIHDERTCTRMRAILRPILTEMPLSDHSLDDINIDPGWCVRFARKWDDAGLDERW